LGNGVTAYFANSILQRDVDLANALLVAESIGAEIEIIDVAPLDWPEFAANPPDRCYLCKKKVYGLIIDRISEKGEVKLFDGTNLDDMYTERPGHKAIKELGVITPLVEAGLTKDNIRKTARKLKLPNWNRVSASCLATRVHQGSQITSLKLNKISACEEVLDQLGFIGCRARLSGDSSSLIIEVQESDIKIVSVNKFRTKILSSLSKFGIEKVYLDLTGR